MTRGTGVALVALATLWGTGPAFAEDTGAGKGNLDRLDDPKIVRRLSGTEAAVPASPAGGAPAVGAGRAPSSATGTGASRAPTALPAGAGAGGLASSAPAVGAGGGAAAAPAAGVGRASSSAVGVGRASSAAAGASGPSPGSSPAVPVAPNLAASPAGAPAVSPLLASAPPPQPSFANAPPVSDAGATPASPEASSAGVVAARAEPPAAEAGPFAPRAEISWRHLPLFRPGAQQDGQAAGKVSDESFSVLTGRIFPTSSLLRFGLAFDFGWEAGRFAVNGDYFLAETTSFGLQHLGRVTPFVEALGGGGYMRRLQTGVSVPSAIWFFGGEGGADFYVASRLYVHASLGFVRVVNGLAQVSGFTLLHEDTWTFRLGFGI